MLWKTRHTDKLTFSGWPFTYQHICIISLKVLKLHPFSNTLQQCPLHQVSAIAMSEYKDSF